MQHHPPATVAAAQHISGASLNFPRWCSTDAKLFTAVSVLRCSGPRRPLCGLQVSAHQRLRLGEGAALLQHVRQPRPWIATGAEKFPRLRGGERVFDFEQLLYLLIFFEQLL